MLTFEKIRDLERAEKESKSLQKLPDNFLEDLASYMKLKGSAETSSDIMELNTVKNTIKRLFELREKKILELAVYSLKSMMPVENLASYEEEMFNSITETLKKHEQHVFSEMKKEPTIQEKKILLRVKKSMLPFVGPDLKVYELRENETIDPGSLPKSLNTFLLKQGVIERVES